MPRKMHQQCFILYWLWQRPAPRDLSYIRISIICNSWIWEFLLLYVWTNSIWAMHKLAMDQNLQICNLPIIKTDREHLEPVDVWITVIYIILHTLVTFPKQMDRCLEKCTKSALFCIQFWQRPVPRVLSCIRISIICNSLIWEFLLLYVWTNSKWAMHKVAMDQNWQICHATIIKTAREHLEPVDV